EALARVGYVAVAKVALHRWERLALLRPRHGMLLLQTLLWQDELRDPGDLASCAPVTDRELELAEVLIRELTGIDVGEVHDEYAHALEQLVDAQITGGELVEPAQPAPALDLMAALEESVRAAKRAHGRPSARHRS
ncbi:Ku protein, partial [Streptomyces viridiviolaceus]